MKSLTDKEQVVTNHCEMCHISELKAQVTIGGISKQFIPSYKSLSSLYQVQCGHGSNRPKEVELEIQTKDGNWLDKNVYTLYNQAGGETRSLCF